MHTQSPPSTRSFAMANMQPPIGLPGRHATAMLLWAGFVVSLLTVPARLLVHAARLNNSARGMAAVPAVLSIGVLSFSENVPAWNVVP